MASLLLFSIGVAVLATFEIQSDYVTGQEWAPMVVFTCAAWLVCYTVSSWAYFRNPYLFSTAYILVLAMFHLGDFSSPTPWASSMCLNGTAAKVAG